MRKIRGGSLIIIMLLALSTILSAMIPAMIPDDGPTIRPLTLEVVKMCGGDNKTRNVTVHNPYSTPIDCWIIPKILPDGEGLNVTFFISGTVFFSGDMFIVDAYQDLDVQVNVTADFALMVLPYVLYLEFYSNPLPDKPPVDPSKTYKSNVKINPPGEPDIIPDNGMEQDDEMPVEPDDGIVLSGVTGKKDMIFDEILFLIGIFVVVIISLLILLSNKKRKTEEK